MNRVKWTQGKILDLCNLSIRVLRLGQIKSQVSVRVSRLSDSSGLHLYPSSTRRQSLVKTLLNYACKISMILSQIWTKPKKGKTRSEPHRQTIWKTSRKLRCLLIKSTPIIVTASMMSLSYLHKLSRILFCWLLNRKWTLDKGNFQNFWWLC